MSNIRLMMELVYKVCSVQQWQAALAQGSWGGSADDVRDGFIHFSCAHQLEATLLKYFKGQDHLVVISFDPAQLGPELRYEPSRNDDLFPHLYAALDPRLALEVTPLLWHDGLPVLSELTKQR
jgi:uncharacterized protein (DUF952 family)